MSHQADHDEASVRLTRADIDAITKVLLEAYAIRGEMDNITYCDLRSKLIRGYYELAHIEVERQIRQERRR